jgi:hypothetical protein
MEIAFIGWGSLLRNKNALNVAGKWQSDGPCLPLEFAYVSKSKILTLAIVPGSCAVQTFWARSGFQEVEVAREALKRLVKSELQNIGFFSRINASSNCRVAPEIIRDLRTWVEQKGLDAVVWIDRGSNFKEAVKMDFNEDRVVDFIIGLSKNERLAVEKYIISNPEQIETTIRRRLRTELGWRNLSEYRTGFWLDKNTFMVADNIDVEMVQRKAEGTPNDKVESVPMLIMTGVTQIVVDNKNKILGEDRKQKMGLWLEDVKKLYKEQKLWHKEG